MKEKYENLDGIRTFAALGILCMHVLILGQFPENTGGTVYKLISGMGVLVRLFFMLSGFGMCCGYYDKMKSGTVDLNTFFSRRYLKIWPFFAVLVCIDILSETVMGSGLSRGVLYEAFANLTLLFGFLPGKDFQVMGIGWTLGVIFGFYCLFPFFVFALWTKRRAWFSFLTTIALNYLCKTYFAAGDMAAGHICLQWMCYFVAGGLIYLYKDSIIKRNQHYPQLGLVLIIAGALFTFVVPPADGIIFQTLKSITGFAMILIGALSNNNKILANAFTSQISDISLEIYLSHVFILRIIQITGILKGIHNRTIAYICMVGLTFLGSVMFEKVLRFISTIIQRKMLKRHPIR